MEKGVSLFRNTLPMVHNLFSRIISLFITESRIKSESNQDNPDPKKGNGYP